MLPQIMPTPWIFVFFLIFLTLFSLILYLSFNPLPSVYSPKNMKVSVSLLPW